ncbi:MAG: hypothetical protein WKF30_17745 [Pyrinomonadaceae bacterium]
MSAGNLTQKLRDSVNRVMECALKWGLLARVSSARDLRVAVNVLRQHE